MGTPRTRKAEDNTQAEAERKDAERRLAPMRMLELMKKAQDVGVETYFVTPTRRSKNDHAFSRMHDSEDVVVEFHLRGQSEEHGFFEDWRTLSLDTSESYEYSAVSSFLEEVKEKKEKAERMRHLAQFTYDSLTQEQREALGLKHRPI